MSNTEAEAIITGRERAILFDTIVGRSLREIGIVEASLLSSRAEAQQLRAQVAELLVVERQREEQFAQQLIDAVAPVNAERAHLQDELFSLRSEMLALRNEIAEAELFNQNAIQDLRRELEEASEAVRAATLNLDELRLRNKDEMKAIREGYETKLASTYEKQEQLESELAQARRFAAELDAQNSAQKTQFAELVTERTELYQHLKMQTGPRALQLVLPLARVIRLLGGRARRGQSDLESTASLNRQQSFLSLKASGHVQRGPSFGIRNAFGNRVRRIAVATILWIVRRFPNQTRSIWNELRARSPDTLSSPNRVTPPSTASFATSATNNGGGEVDPLLAGRVREALLTLTLQDELRQRD